MKLHRLLMSFLTVAFFLLHSAPASAGIKRSIARRAFKGSRGSSRSYGFSGSDGIMSPETFVTGAALSGALFCAACAVIFFLHTWLLTSLLAAKVLTILGFFSFLAWPVFIIALLPPIAIFSLGAASLGESLGPDPYNAAYMILVFAFAAFLYFYLMNVVLAALSPKPWGKRIAYAVALTAVIEGFLMLVIRGDFWPFVLLLLCACCAFAAYKAHGKIAVRAAAKKAAARQKNTVS